MPAITATTADPCICCGAPAAFQCRTRGGTASLCGYSEWTSPSSPPKKYRQLDQGGAYHFVEYNDSGCTISDGNTVDCTWAGTCSYSSVDCSFTAGGTQDCGGGPVTNCGNLGANFQPNVGEVTTTQTRVQAIVTGVCHPANFGKFGKYTAASQYAQLSVEDTEADAIARLLAGGGGTWSSWTVTGDGSGGTCLPATCCLARYEQRTTGFSFVYQEAQVRVTATGLLPSTSYNASVAIWRRTYGVGSYALYATLHLSATTDGSGNFSVDADVPNDEGYETYAESALIYA